MSLCIRHCKERLVEKPFCANWCWKCSASVEKAVPHSVAADVSGHSQQASHMQVLVLYQLQQEVRTPPADLLTEAIAVVRKYASSCYLLRRAGLFSAFLLSPSAPQHTYHCLCLPFFFC